MKQEIIKKMNQDNQFAAKCKEPNLAFTSWNRK